MFVKKKQPDFRGLLRPMSMEHLRIYVARFAKSRDMTDLFPDKAHRRQMATRVFESRWADAQVRVTKSDGTRFFID